LTHDFSVGEQQAERQYTMDTVKPQQPNGDNAVQGIMIDLDSMEPVTGKVILIPEKQEEVPEQKEDQEKRD
jgi:hypothetical protein